MRPIQVILILLIVLMLVYFRRIKSRFLDRVVVLLFAILGTLMIVMPEWTTELAHLVGVGRGADLLFYLGMVSFSFISMLLYSKLREVESRITELARIIAIQHARVPAKPKDGNTDLGALSLDSDK